MPYYSPRDVLQARRARVMHWKRMHGYYYYMLGPVMVGLVKQVSVDPWRWDASVAHLIGSGFQYSLGRDFPSMRTAREAVERAAKNMPRDDWLRK